MECVKQEVKNAISFYPLRATLLVILVVTVSFICLVLEILYDEISERQINLKQPLRTRLSCIGSSINLRKFARLEIT